MLSVCVPNASQSHARAISQKGLRTPQRLLSYFCLAGLFALTLGCSSDPVKQEITRVASPIDMTGHWEMDYAKSDNLQDQLNAVARQIRREAARREQLAKEGRGFAGGPLPGRRDLITLARLAEIITEPTLLEVVQAAGRIRVKRENSFALVCETPIAETAGSQTNTPGISVTTDLLGEQRCGWDGSQLFFMLSLQEGMEVTHRLSRSKAGGELLLVTSVETPDTKFPLIVSQYFKRYDPESLGFICERSLTKGTICTTR